MDNQKYLESFLYSLKEIDTSKSLKEQYLTIEKEFNLNNIDSIIQILSEKTIISKKQRTYKSKPIVYKDFDIDEIEKIITEDSLENILKRFSKSDLQSMYHSIFNVAPLSHYNKANILSELNLYFRNKRRSQAMKL